MPPILSDDSISESINYEDIVINSKNDRYRALIRKNIKKILKNIQIKIKIVVNKKRYDKAVLLKKIKIKLLKYLKESQEIDNEK